MYSGHCLCKSVTWRAEGPITRSLVCHCSDCQRACSAPFTAFLGFEPGQVTWTGGIKRFESSPGTWRSFCPKCGTRLYFRSEKWPSEIHIHAATLDDPASYEPTAQVVLQARMPWLDQLDEIPAHQSFEAPPTVT